MTLTLKIPLSTLVVILFQRVASVPPGTSGIQTELEDGSSESWGRRMKSFDQRIAQDAIGFLDWDERNEEISLEDYKEYLDPSEEDFPLDNKWIWRQGSGIALRRLELTKYDEIGEQMYLDSTEEEEFLLDSKWTWRQGSGIGSRRLELTKYNEISDVKVFSWPLEEIPSEDDLPETFESSNQNGCIPNQLIWPCSCSTSDEEVSITCRNAQGPDLIHRALIPNYPRANMQILNIAGSNIGFLPKDILHGKTFEEMNLFGSGIQGIEEGAFDGCHKTLRLIRLNSNHLHQFNFSQLVDFPNLEMIGLGDNQLTSIEGFVGLPTLPLTTLYMGGNHIKSLPADVFVPLEHLSLLDLSYNDISFIPEGIFLPLKELQSIYLQGNKLGHLTAKSLWFSTPILRSLDIRKLQVNSTDVDVFQGVDISTKVDFSFNRMKHLYSDAFEPILRNVSTGYGILDVMGNKLVCDCDILWILEDERMLDQLIFARCDNRTYLSDLNYEVLAEECSIFSTTTAVWEDAGDEVWEDADYEAWEDADDEVWDDAGDSARKDAGKAAQDAANAT